MKSKFSVKSRNLSFFVFLEWRVAACCDQARRLVMSRDHGGWRQQQQQQRRREPGITVSLHPRDVTKYLYPAIIHWSGRTQQPCVIQYQSSPLSSPPLPSIQISNRNQIYLHLDSHILITHTALYILLRTWLDLPSSVNLHRIARMLDRPGLRPGCDTEALAGEFLLLYLWWNAFSGSRESGPELCSILGSGLREEVRWCFELFPHTLPSVHTAAASSEQSPFDINSPRNCCQGYN